MRNILALIGLGFLIYQFQLLKYLSPLWGKLQKDSDIQKVEKVIKPLAEKAKNDLGIGATPSPTASPTTSPKSTTKNSDKFGVKFEAVTPVGKLESGVGVTIETKKDLGVKDDSK